MKTIGIFYVDGQLWTDMDKMDDYGHVLICPFLSKKFFCT